LRGIDADRERFTTVRAFHLVFFDQIHGFLLCGVQLQPRSVAPKVLQGVILSLLLIEKVHNDIAKVRDDPLALRKTVHGHGLDSMLLEQAILKLVGQCLEVRLAGSRGDEEEVSNRGDSPQIDCDEALGFLIGEDFGAELG